MGQQQENYVNCRGGKPKDDIKLQRGGGGLKHPKKDDVIYEQPLKGCLPSKVLFRFVVSNVFKNVL